MSHDAQEATQRIFQWSAWLLTLVRHLLTMERMTTAMHGRIPALTLGWRLKMALSEGNVSREKMAELLGVAPATCSRWMSDTGAPPRRAYLTQWALVTDTDLDWLLTGRGTSDGPGGDERHDQRAELERIATAKRSRKAATRGQADTPRYLTAA